MNALVSFNGRQLDLIRKTVAKDCDRDSNGIDLHLGEFDWAIQICRSLRLDPLRRQIYFFVFGKDDPKRRQMVPVVGIGGYRAIAARTGNYRPNDQPPVFEYDATLVSLANPKGLVKATETVWQYQHGEWFPVRAEARWDAYAPIVETADGGYDYIDTGEKWADSGKPKKKRVPKGEIVRKLDPNKERWHVDPEGMLAKCAEALALRKAWPDDFAGTYVEGELDRADALDLTPTELANEADADAKLALIGGRYALTVDWCDGSKLERVSEGSFCDRVLAWSNDPDRCATELRVWFQRNEASRAEFKARHGGEYLEFMKAYEARLKVLDESDARVEAAE